MQKIIELPHLEFLHLEQYPYALKKSSFLVVEFCMVGLDYMAHSFPQPGLKCVEIELKGHKSNLIIFVFFFNGILPFSGF